MGYGRDVAIVFKEADTVPVTIKSQHIVKRMYKQAKLLALDTSSTATAFVKPIRENQCKMTKNESSAWTLDRPKLSWSVDLFPIYIANTLRYSRNTICIICICLTVWMSVP